MAVLGGCIGRKRGYPPQPATIDPARTNGGLIVTPDEGLRGKVQSANENLRFAVLTFMGRMPEIDQRLIVYRRGLKVGEVRITGPREDSNIVADIVAGEAAAGDDVTER